LQVVRLFPASLLRFVANGRTNPEIGSIHQICGETARNHLISLLAKLEAKDRIQAATIGIQQGLIRAAQ
jgi:DNA-binding NarL/FixJ family response regulator